MNELIRDGVKGGGDGSSDGILSILTTNERGSTSLLQATVLKPRPDDTAKELIGGMVVGRIGRPVGQTGKPFFAFGIENRRRNRVDQRRTGGRPSRDAVVALHRRQTFRRHQQQLLHG